MSMFGSDGGSDGGHDHSYDCVCYNKPEPIVVEVSKPRLNPDYTRWTLIELHQFVHTHVLKVRYHDCTNHKGLKLMVFTGSFDPNTKVINPHFSPTGPTPIARFIPNELGTNLALNFARNYSP